MRPGSSRGRALAALAVVVALASPAGALAASPLSGVPSSSTPVTTAPAVATDTTATVPSTSSGNGGLTMFEKIGIGVVTVGLFGAIIYVIRTDARLNAPRHATLDIDSERATVAPRAERIKRSRAKAKAARAARRSQRARR